jgi:trehalose/maltose transport system permease protein
VLYIVLAMTMFPQIAILGSLYAMVTRFNLYNSLWSLVITYMIFTLPFTVWVLTTFFQAMPRELEEAAYVDGATPLQTFYRVLLPLAAPGMVTTGLLAFIAAWNEFLFALSFTQTPDKRTVTLALFYFDPPTQTGSSFAIAWGQIMAATVIITIPLIVLTLIFQRRILAGLTAGAVKG